MRNIGGMRETSLQIGNKTESICGIICQMCGIIPWKVNFSLLPRVLTSLLFLSVSQLKLSGLCYQDHRVCVLTQCEFLSFEN